MDIKSYFAEKLSKLLFLEIKKEKLYETFKVENDQSVYVAVGTDDIAERVKKGNSLDKIPMSFFIEGMFFVLGTDNNFKYNDYYKKVLKKSEDSVKFIKSKISSYVKQKNFENAYILLKGLSKIEPTKEIFEKMLLLCDDLRKKSKMYKDEEIEIIEEAKTIKDFYQPYLYESFVCNDIGDYQKALFCLNTYLANGGTSTKDIESFKDSLKIINDYDRGKALVREEPENALKFLLPLIDNLGDSAELFYNIGVAYRNLKNHDKAIYYLIESLKVDNAAVEVINELAINYAAVGQYEKAISYFRDAFQYTGSVEICTNLIMCYLNTNNIKQAKIHLKLAKKIDPKDEVVLDIEKLFNKLGIKQE